MQVFINECSLTEQFQEYNFADSLRVFLATINSLNSFKAKTLFKSNLFFNYKAIKDTHLGTTLKKDQNLNALFVENMRSVASWHDEQSHDLNSSYIYNKEEYVSTSVAEITERKIKVPDLKALLINFIESKFAENPTIQVNKNGIISTNISCVFDATSIHEWLIDNGYIDPKAEYDVKLGLPPLDKQTVLLISDKFEITKWRNGKYGRRVFRLKDSNQLWVVDSSLKHATGKAHLEVFDETSKKHLGTSIYNSIALNSAYKKNNRTINLV